MSRSTFVALTIGIVIGGLSYPSRADDDTDLESLLNETVVTTASKSAEAMTSAPATSVVITAEDLRAYGIHTLGEAVDFLSVGALSSTESSEGGMGARGVIIPSDDGNHVLLLINGHQINNLFAGGASFGVSAGIPLELVDHIEIVLGPGSVLYGSNAMLGVINVVTKRAKDYRGTRVGVESQILTSVRPWAGAGYRFELFGVPSELTFQLEYFKKDGPHLYYDPENTEPDRFSGPSTVGSQTSTWGGAKATHTAFVDAPSAVARLITGDVEVNLRASAARASVENSLGSVSSPFDDPKTRTMSREIFLDVKYRKVLSKVVQVTGRVYADGYDNHAAIGNTNPSVCSTESVCYLNAFHESRLAGLELQSSWDWFGNTRFVTLVGVDPRIRMGHSQTDTFGGTTGAPVSMTTGIFKHSDVALAAFAQQTWRATEWLDLNGGARLDYDERFRAVISPRLAAATNVWGGGTVKAIYSQAFRAPSFFESYYSHPYIPLPENLRPETVRSMEMSLEQVFGAQRLFFGLFRSILTDLIEFHAFTAQEQADYMRRTGTTIPVFLQRQNVASITNYGLNAGYEGSVIDGTLRFGANVTSAIAERNDPATGSVPLTVAPRIFGNARVSYDLPGDLPTIGLAAYAMGKRIVDIAYEGGFHPIPYAPPQLELRATVSGAVPGVHGLSYRVSANFLLADRAPYAVGPATRSTPENPAPRLVPLDTVRTTVGLQYEF